MKQLMSSVGTVCINVLATAITKPLDTPFILINDIFLKQENITFPINQYRRIKTKLLLKYIT